MGIEEQIERSEADMEATETQLRDSGFSEMHWMLIKDYIRFAIYNAQLHQSREWQAIAANELKKRS